MIADYNTRSRPEVVFADSSSDYANVRLPSRPLRTIASCRMMRVMSGTVRPTMTSSAICVISITETTMITVPAGPGGRD